MRIAIAHIIKKIIATINKIIKKCHQIKPVVNKTFKLLKIISLNACITKTTNGIEIIDPIINGGKRPLRIIVHF